MREIRFVVLVVSSLFLSLTAYAQRTAPPIDTTNQVPPPDRQKRPPRGERPQFADLLADMDSNKDGKLSKKEIKGPLKKDFARVDKNEDGFITEEEFKAAPPPPPRRREN